MIKILHVIGAMDRGGAETMIMNFYRKLDTTKYQFDFLVHEERECDYDKEIESLGGTIYRVPRYNILNYFSYKRKCDDFFKEHKDYDIVHGHIGSCANIYLSVAKKHNLITIAHSHASSFAPSLYSLVFKIMTYRTRYIADYFFACSKQAGIDRYGKNIANKENFFIIKNGIDVKKYQYSAKRHNDLKIKFGLENNIVYGHVGRFAKVKNHSFLIDVFNEISQKEKNAILLLVGRGPLEDKIKEKVKALGLSNKVMFLGIRNDVDDLVNLMDVFIFPSTSEGLAITLVEAQSADLPCIISDTIPCDGIISEKVVQLSLTESPKRWAEIILEKSCTVRKDVSYKICDAGFDVLTALMNLCQIYEDMINRKL